METSEECLAGTVIGTRRYTSPNRILARCFRIGRDKWKNRHHVVQAKLEQMRQLAAERGASRDQWRAQCEAAAARAAAAESFATQCQTELEQVRVRFAELEVAAQKKIR